MDAIDGDPKKESSRFKVSAVLSFDNFLISGKSGKEVDDLNSNRPSEENTSRRPSRLSGLTDWLGITKAPDGTSLSSRRGSKVSEGSGKQYDNPPARRASRRLSVMFSDFLRESVFEDKTTPYLPWLEEDSHETVPRLESYRNSISTTGFKQRATLDDIHDPRGCEQDEENDLKYIEEASSDSKAVKFGWIKGVYIRCLLNIWGVMLFLRMGWMTAQAGIILSILIVILSSTVTFITTMSMSAICTNGEVKGGGAYYMISRSLGPEFGGAIGLIFSFANCVAAAMYIIGAAETVRDLLNVFHVGIVEFPSAVNDVRISGVILLILTTAVTSVGMAFENKTQVLLLVLLVIGLMDYFVGACLPPTDIQRAKGFLGWNWDVAKENMGPDFRDGHHFFTVLAIFFPSVTGILAGANISGDLKDPSSAIPKGTFLSIITSTVVYIIIIIWLGFTCVRDATGNLADLANNTFRDCENKTCSYGMMNYNQIMEMTSGYGPLIYVGIFAATLSSALAALVSAPRIFQALCKDDIFPYVKHLAKGYGPNRDPYRAAVVVFIVALLFTVIAELNAVAPIISNFFMATYGLVNFSCFHATLVDSPGFRPSFKYYNKWLSLVGALLCVVVMCIMNYITALITFVIVLALYIYIHRANLDINWGSSTQGIIFRDALLSVLKLNKVEEHVKNYRPSVLVLTGNPSSRPPLVDFSNHLTKKSGLMMCGHIMKGPVNWHVRNALQDFTTNWLEKRKAKGFYTVVEADTFSSGVHILLETVGLGKLKPNILLLGYKRKWQECTPSELEDYFSIFHEAFDSHIALAVLRMPAGVDFSAYYETKIGLPADNVVLLENIKYQPLVSGANITDDSVISLETVAEEEPATVPDVTIIDTDSLSVKTVNQSQLKIESNSQIDEPIQDISEDVLNSANFFLNKQKKGTIDVWWLYDDGGLTLLLPYLLTTRSYYSQCKLRCFSMATSEGEISEERANMAALLNKFRIEYTDVSVLSTINVPPHEESKKMFQKMTSKWLNQDDNVKNEMSITKADLMNHKKTTNRYLRLRELLVQHSLDSTLIVMTLPMPRKDSYPAPLYMAWLETLTHNMPPFLLVRGNQTSVLTFYS